MEHVCDTAFNRHSNETVTPRKHVPKYKNMRKWMIEFPRKFENRDIKFVRINSLLITKSISLLLLTLILYGLGVEGDFTFSVN